jgi:diguanylate cyclase (GGDEF)-like protein
MALLTSAPSHEDEDYLAHLAYHDPLTDLPNRTRLAERLRKALPRAVNGASVALLSIDLDGFKTVNDSLGRDAGDELLCQVARRLDSVRRTSDMLVRQAGDEFTLLAELEAGLDATAVGIAMAERIRSVLEESFTLADAELRLTASVGAAIYPEDALDARALLRNADAAMYAAKEDGSGFGLYRPGADKPMGRMSMAAALRRGLRNEEFLLHYQPIYRLADRKLIGLEALVRWRREQGTIVAPDTFIPAAERTGVINALGDWVLETLCRQAILWEALDLRPNFGINVSPRQLERPRFASDFASIVARSGLDPRRLIVELTESAWTVEASRTQGALKALTDAGFSLAIDDFGAGYSSLSRLRALPVSVIKIDRSFLVGLPDDPQATAIVEAILALATACGCDVVCEGVETDAQLGFLRASGCLLVQGFGLGRPQPAEAITELLIVELAADRRAAA